MLQRKIAGLAAALCLIASIPLTPAVAADDSYDMQVSVNLAGEKKAISPYIYGVNDHISGSNLKNVTTHNARQGGNRYTGYNWETNWSNAGQDWQHSSDTNIGDLSDGTAFAARHFSENCEKYGVPFKLATLQMAGYVSADKSGTVATSEVAPSARWNKVEFRKDGELSLEPDLNDGVVLQSRFDVDRFDRVRRVFVVFNDEDFVSAAFVFGDRVNGNRKDILPIFDGDFLAGFHSDLQAVCRMGNVDSRVKSGGGGAGADRS